MELEKVEKSLADLEVDVASHDEDGGDGPELCITSSMTGRSSH